MTTPQFNTESNINFFSLTLQGAFIFFNLSIFLYYLDLIIVLDLTNHLIHPIQNGAEVLQFVIYEKKGTSVAASDLISNVIRINVSCNQCFCFSAKEEKLDIQTTSLSPYINSLSKFLLPEILESDNKWFHQSRKSLTESTRETFIIGLGSVLAIQLG